MALGQLYAQHGQPEKATPWFQKGLDAASNSFDKAMAQAALGYINEKIGKHSDALALFEKALNQGEATLKGDLLMAIARCHEGLKDGAKARATYDQIIKQLPNTEYAKNAQLYKDMLE